MAERVEETSPRLKARVAGLLYLVNIAAGAFHYGFVRSAMIAPGDAGATAANIVAHGMLYRLGFAAAIVLLLCNVPLALIFYDLFRVVNRSLAVLVAFFMLVGTAIETANLLNYFAPLILLSDTHYLKAFAPQQLQSMAYVSLELHAIGFDLAVVFFAFYDLVIAYLLFTATFLPRILGVLMAMAGLCYLTKSFATFLSPRFAANLLPYILMPSGVGELSLCLWLLVVGLNASRWKDQAGIAEDR